MIGCKLLYTYVALVIQFNSNDPGVPYIGKIILKIMND